LGPLGPSGASRALPRLGQGPAEQQDYLPKKRKDKVLSRGGTTAEGMAQAPPSHRNLESGGWRELGSLRAPCCHWAAGQSCSATLSVADSQGRSRTGRPPSCPSHLEYHRSFAYPPSSPTAAEPPNIITNSQLPELERVLSRIVSRLFLAVFFVPSLPCPSLPFQYKTGTP
jgi:hypothetical protein